MKRIILIILLITLCLPILAGCGVVLKNNTDPDIIPTAKKSNFPSEPPHLSVSDVNSTVQAWRGTHSWFVENENGMGSGVNADSPHPLDCTDSIQAIKITKKTTLTLNFDGAPTSITVRRYKLNTSDYNSYDEITVSGNSIEVNAGDYLYEVIASWSGQHYNGTVYYAFRTEK